MYHKKKDRFSIRKFKIGVGSIFLGSFLLVTPQVFASEKENPDTLTSVQPLEEASGPENPTSPKAGQARAKEDKKEDKQEDKEKASALPSGAEAKTGDQALEKGESLESTAEKSPANLGSENKKAEAGKAENKKAEDREAREEKTEEKAEEKERHITIEDFKNMEPEDLKKLTLKDFEDLKPSQEVVDSLSDEQQKALQESVAYQEYKKANKPLKRSRRQASPAPNNNVTNIRGHEFRNNATTLPQDREKSKKERHGSFVNGNLDNLPASLNNLVMPSRGTGNAYAERGGQAKYLDIKPSDLTEDQRNAFGWKPIAQDGYVTVMENYMQSAFDGVSVKPNTKYLSLGKFAEYFKKQNARREVGYEGFYQDVDVNPGSKFVFGFEVADSANLVIGSSNTRHPVHISIHSVDAMGNEQDAIVQDTKINRGNQIKFVSIPDNVNKIRIKMWDDYSAADWTHKYSTMLARNFRVVNPGGVTTDYVPTTKYAVSGGAAHKATFNGVSVKAFAEDAPTRLEGWVVTAPNSSGLSFAEAGPNNNNNNEWNSWTLSGSKGVAKGTLTHENPKTLKFAVSVPDNITEKKEYELKGTLKYKTSATDFSGVTDAITDVDLDPGLLVVLPQALPTTTKKTVAKNASLGNPEDFISNRSAIEADSMNRTIINYAWQTAPDTANAGTNKTARIVVTYNFPDGTSDTVTKSITYDVTDKDDLIAKVTEGDNLKSQTKYTSAHESFRNAFDQALQNAKQIKDKPDASQTEVNVAVTALENAKNALNGESVNTAVQELGQAQTNADTEIDGKAGLEDQDKQKAKDAVATATNAAILAAGAATTDADLNTAKTTGTDKVNAIKALAEKQNEVNEAINNNPDLRPEDKLAAKEKVAAATAAAMDAVNNAANTNEINAAKTLGENKADALKDLADKQGQANKAIDGSQHVGPADKDLAKQAIAAATADAMGAVNAAADTNGINAAKQTATPGIDLAKAKAAAIEEVELARSDAKAAIEQNNHLSPEQQQAAKDEVDQAATDAIRDINAATDNNGINTAKASGLTGIDLAKTKADAIDAVEAAVEAAQADIDGDDLLNTDEKEQVLNAVKAEAARVVNSIKAQTDKNNIPDVKDAGIEDIVLKKAKELAKKRVEKTAENKEQAIRTSKMTDSEKQAALRDVRQAKQDAIDAIDNTHTNTEGAAKQAGKLGETNINNVSTDSRAKTDAKNAIDQSKADKLRDIDGPGNNQTAEEKAATKAEVERLAREAKANIDAATTDRDVEIAKTNGTRVIEGVPTNSAKKDTAVQELGQAQTNADTEIDGKAGLEDQDKQKAKDAVATATNAAILAAGAATTDADLNTAKTTGTDKVNAIKALAEKQNEVNEAINNNPDLRPEDKLAAKEKVAAATAAAMDAVNNAANTNEINAAKTLGENKADALKDLADKQGQANKAIDGSQHVGPADKDLAKQAIAAATADAMGAVNAAADTNGINAAKQTATPGIDLAKAKAAAIEEVELARSDAKAAIEQNNHLSPEQQQAAKDEVDQAATDAIRDINAATDNNGIDTAKASGLTGIDLAKTKADAIDAVEAAVEAAQADIDGDDLLNTDEKEQVLNAVKAEAARVVNSIKAQTDKNNIPDVKDAGIEDIVLKKAKELAKKRVEKTAENKEQAIRTSKMTDSEKQAALRDVRQAKQDAIDAIDNTHTNTEGAAKQAGKLGETNINNVSTDSRAKTDAKNAIDQSKADKLRDIDGPGNNQTAEEKAATKAEVERLAREAKANIDAATTDRDVEIAKTNGTRVIEGVPTNSAKKDTAVQELGQAQTNADTEIDGKAGLEDQDKQKAKDAVATATNAAILAAGAATTDADLNTAKTTGTDKVNAIKALAEKQNEVNEAINNNPDLRPEDKLAAKEKVAAATAAAMDAVNNAANTNEINAAKTLGENKADALKDLADKQGQANKAIDGSQHVGPADKDLAKQAIAAATADAMGAVNAAADTNGINAAKQTATPGIDLAKAKAAAIEEVELARSDAKAAIEQNNHLSPEQQQRAKDEVDQAATDAIRDINAATDNNGIDTAKASGLTGIELAQTKADAISEVEAEKAQAHQDIDNTPGLSDKQKADAKAKVDAAAKEAEANINAAPDTNAITQPKENGKTKVELEKEKADAIGKIEVEKQASNDAIEADNNLDRDQKDAAKDKITKAAKEAEDNINAAPDKDGITQPKENGLEKVKLEKPKQMQ
ncbi:DUF1542 domain-containing protein [Gemella sp. zg-570]|uniref:DUF1542 domain-containing protein n=1 Tax=Gemella sp. zg-570 TaxID=2840371 RepID=UPI001C0C0192|nr:DUF1542 domain-containing protein [Gemella sp. zg-570]QWQ38553.1 DUF1542 domain-containing protein [Gemella sp. zg-570]